VKQTSLEVLVSYTFAEGWYVETDPVITRGWLASPRDAWAIPVGLDAGKGLPARLGLDQRADRSV